MIPTRFTEDGRTAIARERRGVAMGMVIMFLFVLTAALAAGFAVNLGERRADDAARQAAQTLAIAEGGLERALVDRAALGFTATPPAAAESTRVTFTGGYYDVTVTRIRPAVGNAPALYVVRSHAVRTKSGTGGERNSEQTVSQLVTWQTGSMTVSSAWTSLTGISKNGASGTISGVDGCGAKASLPAVSVPAVPGYSQSGGSISSVLSGATPLVDTTKGHTATAMAPNVNIDWAGIAKGTSITATVNYPTQSFPTTAQMSDTTYWPIIVVNNGPTGNANFASGQSGTTFDLPRQGHGLLIILGDLTISGSDMWSGIVLVGGTVTSNGNNSVNGSVVSGLNTKFGISVGVEAIGNGNKHFQYNSCSVALATGALGALRPYGNTWSSSWPTF